MRSFQIHSEIISDFFLNQSIYELTVYIQNRSSAFKNHFLTLITHPTKILTRVTSAGIETDGFDNNLENLDNLEDEVKRDQADNLGNVCLGENIK